MSYEKQEWVAQTTVISAARMNHIENGIQTVDNAISEEASNRAAAIETLSGGVTEINDKLETIGGKAEDGVTNWIIGGLKASMAAAASETNRCRVTVADLPVVPDNQVVIVHIDDGYFARVGVYESRVYSSLYALVADEFASGDIVISSEYTGMYIGFNVKKEDNSDFTQEEVDDLVNHIKIYKTTKIGDVEDLNTTNKSTVIGAINEVNHTIENELYKNLFVSGDYGADYVTTVTFANSSGSCVYTKTGQIMSMNGSRSTFTTVGEAMTTDALVRVSGTMSDSQFANPTLTLKAGRKYLASVKFLSGSIGTTAASQRNYDFLLCTYDGVTSVNKLVKRVSIDAEGTLSATDIQGGSVIIIPPTDVTCGFVFGNRGYITLSNFTVMFDIKDVTDYEMGVDIAAQDIISANKEAIDMIRASNWWTGNRSEKPSMLNLIHFSDIHAWQEPLYRIVTLKNYLAGLGMMTDAICTGDIVESSWGSGASFAKWASVSGSDDILFSIGNHDTYAQTSGSHGKLTSAALYANYFADRVENWGVTIDTDASYYYKDYPDQKIRLIVVDPGVEDDEGGYPQGEWLKGLLNDFVPDPTSTDLERETEKAKWWVIIASHFLRIGKTTSVNSVTIMDNDWSNHKARNTEGTIIMSYDWPGTDIVGYVTNYIQSGGHFMCYLIGHTHTDILSYPTGHPDQLIISICSASTDQTNGSNTTNISNDLPRYADTKTQDAINVITIDPNNKLLKCVRVGSNVTMHQRSRKAFCWDYANANMVSMI